MRTSETIGEVLPGILKAQASIKPVNKGGVNPHYGSKFASLDDILDEVIPKLNKQGLVLLQGTLDVEGSCEVVSRVCHAASGEWVETSVPVHASDARNPQAVGSAITYGRRYCLSALLALATEEDDDGQAGTKTPNGSTSKTSATPPATPIEEKTLKHIGALLKESGMPVEELKKKIKETYGVNSRKDLTAAEASQVVKALERRKAQRLALETGENQPPKAEPPPDLSEPDVLDDIL